MCQNNLFAPAPEQDSLLDPIVDYIGDHLDLFDKQYMWPMHHGNHIPSSKDEAQTVREFAGFNVQNAKRIQDILDWGGISNSERISKEYFNVVNRIQDDDSIKDVLQLGKNGSNWRIASWSKVLAVVKPGFFFIYDSRGAIALSFITMSAGCSCYWQIPSPREEGGNDGEYAIFKNACKSSRNQRKAYSMDVCYDLYVKLLQRMKKIKGVKDRYDNLSDDIKNAYFRCGFEEDKAIMAHLEKMLFMMKERILQLPDYQPQHN